MNNCHRNNVGNLVLGHHHKTTTTTTTTTLPTNFRLWNSASIRRIILDAISCGASSRFNHRGRHYEDNSDDENEEVSSTTRSQSSSEDKQLKRKNSSSNVKSEKLSDLLNMAETESLLEAKSKQEALEEMKKLVKDLQQEDDCVKRLEAAKAVRMLAKENLEVRGTLAMLGVIPPLVSLIDSQQDRDSQIASLYALLNLGIGNDANKAAIVKVGSVHKMLKLIESPEVTDSAVSEAIVANFLGLSALDSNKPVIGSSAAIPFLVRTLKNNSCSSQAKQDALRALYNLSIFPANITFILETHLVPFLINSIGDMEVTERNLSVLSNLVSTREGRKAISAVPDAFPILVDVLNWADSPECQEKVSYVLMVMSYKSSYGDRQAMIEAGIVTSLLELSLIGTTLAQKRASRLLESLRIDKGKQVSGNYGGNLGATVSAPIYGSSSCAKADEGGKECSEEEEDMMSEEKKAVRQLVQQSLQNNMRKIVKRANLPQDIAPSDHFKSLTLSSTSKSLPF